MAIILKMCFNTVTCKLIHLETANTEYAYRMRACTLESSDTEKDVAVIRNVTLT